ARAAREHVQIKKPLEVDSLPARPSTPIVLRVASGPRAGEFVGVEGSEFAVGDDPSCELHLPAPSVGAPGVVVRLRRDAEGWKLATNQARVFVNGEAAKSTASIRSGDVIRLTPAGPDVQFLVQSQNQKTLEKLIATYWPKPAPRRGGGQRAAPRPAGPAPAPRAEVRPAPAPPSPRAAGGGNGASAPRPQPAGARPSAPSAAPQPPGPQRSSGRPAGLRQRWEEYYASNKDQANRWILVVGVVVIAVIVILLPSGEPDPAPQDPAEPAAVAGPDSAPPRPAADEDGQP
ncbi:MAG TPA: hypothetical protein PJ982_12235, partial [Lacipirellulaceae bacterium]|nr:hypothetical protein [Lacipirellulaceae bacterium]